MACLPAAFRETGVWPDCRGARRKNSRLPAPVALDCMAGATTA